MIALYSVYANGLKVGDSKFTQGICGSGVPWLTLPLWPSDQKPSVAAGQLSPCGGWVQVTETKRHCTALDDKHPGFQCRFSHKAWSLSSVVSHFLAPSLVKGSGWTLEWPIKLKVQPWCFRFQVPVKRICKMLKSWKYPQGFIRWEIIEIFWTHQSVTTCNNGNINL